MSDAADILQQMLDAVPNSYQKTVLFPTYDILAAASVPIAEQARALEEAREKLNLANLKGAELDAYIVPRTGQTRTPATCAIGEVTVTGAGTVEEGDLFESQGGIQFQAV